MWNKLIALIIVCVLAIPASGFEVVEDLERPNTPVLNEELRKLKTDIRNLEATSTDVHTMVWYVNGGLFTGTSKAGRYDVQWAGTLTKATAYVDTAPTDATIIVDINLNGTTLWASGKLIIADAANSGNKTTFDSTAVAVGDYFTMDIDQVGSTEAGDDLTVQLVFTETITGSSTGSFTK